MNKTWIYPLWTRLSFYNFYVNNCKTRLFCETKYFFKIKDEEKMKRRYIAHKKTLPLQHEHNPLSSLFPEEKPVFKILYLDFSFKFYNYIFSQVLLPLLRVPPPGANTPPPGAPPTQPTPCSLLLTPLWSLDPARPWLRTRS